MRHGPRPRNEFLIWQRVAGAKEFGHLTPIRSHGTPFVVVALQPDFVEIVEPTVGGDVGGAEMGMVVEDGLRLGVFVIQPARGFAVEQEVVAQK